MKSGDVKPVKCHTKNSQNPGSDHLHLHGRGPRASPGTATSQSVKVGQGDPQSSTAGGAPPLSLIKGGVLDEQPGTDSRWLFTELVSHSARQDKGSASGQEPAGKRTEALCQHAGARSRALAPPGPPVTTAIWAKLRPSLSEHALKVSTLPPAVSPPRGSLGIN